MEQPREPRFYQDEDVSVFAIGQKNGELYAVDRNNALQSIDSTLKRIEAILLDFQKSGRSPLEAMRNAVGELVSQNQEPVRISLNVNGNEFAKLQSMEMKKEGEMEENNVFAKERELLHKQFELLAEQSKGCDPRELAEVSAQMVAIYSALHK